MRTAMTTLSTAARAVRAFSPASWGRLPRAVARLSSPATPPEAKRPTPYSNIKPEDRPDEETVKRLSEQAKQSERMWNFLVPERNIDYRGVVGLVAIILALHTYNSYNRRDKVVDSLPPGAKEQLANGSYLMKDGSIRQIDFTPTPTRAPAKLEESTMMLDKFFARFR